MSMDNTIIQQGRFTADGNAKTLNLRSDVDWIRVYNTTIMTAGGADTLAEAYWQRGMSTGFGYLKTTATNALAVGALTSGFTLVDTSDQALGALTSTITAVSAAAIPVVTNTGVNGLSAGDVVRLINVAGGVQLGGIDFTVGNNTLSNTTYSLDYMSQIVAGTTGSWRKVNTDPLYYPTRRYITKISKAASAIVTFSVTHGYTVGQEIRFQVDGDVYGMGEIDGLIGTITAVSTANNTITVDIDSTAFTTFAFPVTAVAALGFTPAQGISVGEDSYTARTAGLTLKDATTNTGYIGITLAAGTTEPAGALNDVIYWVAGKSFSNLDEV